MASVYSKASVSVPNKTHTPPNWVWKSHLYSSGKVPDRSLAGVINSYRRNLRQGDVRDDDPVLPYSILCEEIEAKREEINFPVDSVLCSLEHCEGVQGLSKGQVERRGRSR